MAMEELHKELAEVSAKSQAAAEKNTGGTPIVQMRVAENP